MHKHFEVLILCITLSGCLTIGLWQDDKKVSTQDQIYSGNSVAIAILSTDKIALMPGPNNVLTGNLEGHYQNMATVYQFDDPDFEHLANNIRQTTIREIIEVDYQSQEIRSKQAHLEITLLDGTSVTPRHVTTTLSDDLENPYRITGEAIQFSRTIIEKRTEIDSSTQKSFLYKTALTPVNLAGDVVILGVGAVAAVGALSLVIALCTIPGDQCF